MTFHRGSGVRLASVAMGDDCTLTRYIKEPDWQHSGRTTAPMPSDATGTRFKTRVLQPNDNMLVSGHSNVKIGRDVRKGRFIGYWIYTLSLEERATCPSTCQYWTTCYSNSMPFAKRLDHNHLEFLSRLEANIKRLLSTRGRKGILIRLHALGDFYSVEYVAFWNRMLREHANLAVYGYTARSRDSEIGIHIQALKMAHDRRAAIRWSCGGAAVDCTVDIEHADDCPPDAFVCPEQTNKTRACATCGACWTGDKNVAFIAH